MSWIIERVAVAVISAGLLYVALVCGSGNMDGGRTAVSSVWETPLDGARILNRHVVTGSPVDIGPGSSFSVIRGSIVFETGSYDALVCESGSVLFRDALIDGASILIKDGKIVLENTVLKDCVIRLEGSARLFAESSTGGRVRFGEDFSGEIELLGSNGWIFETEKSGELTATDRDWYFPEKASEIFRLVDSDLKEICFTVREGFPLVLKNYPDTAAVFFFNRAVPDRGLMSLPEMIFPEEEDTVLVTGLGPRTDGSITAGNALISVPGTRIVRCAVTAAGSTSLEIENSEIDLLTAQDAAVVSVFASELNNIVSHDTSGIQVYDSRISGKVTICEESSLFLENSYPSDYSYENRENDYFFYLDGRRYEPMTPE